MLQYLIVAIVVVAAALHAAAKYLPLAWRERIVRKLSQGTGQGWWRSRLIRWFGTDASCGSGCDTCGSCETEAETPPERDEKGRKIIRLHVQR